MANEGFSVTPEGKYALVASIPYNELSAVARYIVRDADGRESEFEVLPHNGMFLLCPNVDFLQKATLPFTFFAYPKQGATFFFCA